MMDSFTTFQLMYLILYALNEEKSDEKVVLFLTDANPFMRTGENSVDVVVYNDFKKKYDDYSDHSDYSYEFVCKYLKEIEYYKNLYKMFSKITKEDYVSNCKEILKDGSVLKKLA